MKVHESDISDLDYINQRISIMLTKDIGNVSDGQNTFNDLYNIKMAYDVALASLANTSSYFNVYKSKNDHKGSPLVDGDRFMIVIESSSGVIMNDYLIEHWDKFNIPVLDKARHHLKRYSLNDLSLKLLNISDENN